VNLQDIDKLKPPKLLNIPLGKIDLGDRARKEYGDMSSLIKDIEEKGVIQSVAVMQLDDKGSLIDEYLLLGGGRRYKACVSIGLPTIPCRVYPPLDEYDRKLVEEAENIHREDLTIFEKANLTKRIHDLRTAKYGETAGAAGVGHSQTDTAVILGISQQKVSLDLQLAQAIEIMPELTKCKTQSEALKLFNRIKEDLIKEELGRRADEILSKDGEDAVRRTLISNYIIGDFFKISDKLPNRSFHVCEVDPPFAIRLDEVKRADKDVTHGYNEVSIADYPQFLKRTIDICSEKLMDDGWLLFWFAAHPWYSVLESILRKAGFTFCHPAIWTKGIPGQVNWPDRYLGSSYEPFFYARKGSGVLYRQGRANNFGYPPVPAQKKDHPTERPIEMMEEILSCFCPPNGRVLVPFAGSGDTILAADNLGMSAVGCDLSSVYKASYVYKVMEGTPRRYKSYTNKQTEISL
jgi:ParB/RepB/Spo0J family partition protein